MASQTRTYDGYVEILDRVRGIVKSELLTDMQKDSLLTKIEDFEYEIGEIITGREEWNNTLMEASQRSKDDRSD
jgi:hypothetical protein|tara:strand:- start:9788 stop:10009 length:222 start_codon:yes stop_codon:yes gene_type:complete